LTSHFKLRQLKIGIDLQKPFSTGCVAGVYHSSLLSRFLLVNFFSSSMHTSTCPKVYVCMVCLSGSVWVMELGVWECRTWLVMCATLQWYA